MSGKLKLTFGPPPKTFKKTVKVTLSDGSQIEFDVTFKHRTRSQYGELMDEISAVVQSEPIKTETIGEPPSFVKTLKSVMDEGNQSDVDAVLKMAEGWSLDDPFTAENLLFINDNYPGVVVAINEAYRDAILNGRIKN